jgi:hypothetical protein
MFVSHWKDQVTKKAEIVACLSHAHAAMAVLTHLVLLLCFVSSELAARVHGQHLGTLGNKLITCVQI